MRDNGPRWMRVWLIGQRTLSGVVLFALIVEGIPRAVRFGLVAAYVASFIGMYVVTSHLGKQRRAAKAQAAWHGP